MAVFFLIVWFNQAFAQLASLPTFDNFSYTAGTTLDGQGFWQLSTSGTNKDTIADFSLNYSGYPFSGVGKSVRMGTDREALGYGIVEVASGPIYYSFMFKADSSSLTGSAILCLSSVGSSERFAVVYLKDTGSDWHIGLRKSSAGVNPIYVTSKNLAKTDTHVVVVKYVFLGTDIDQNDSLYLWVDPVLGSSEPAADIAMTDGATGDAPDFDFVELLEQVVGSNNELDSTYLYVDGLRIATTWSEAPMPVQMLAFEAAANRLDVSLRWSTATEVNNFGYDVERKAVGEENWQRVGFVQGWGTSTEPREYAYVDAGLSAGRYAYRIKQLDLDGTFTYFIAAEVEVGVAPKELALEPNYPNPFNPATQISFTVPEDGKAVLKVYNMLGQEVAVLFDEVAEAGKLYQQTFDASSLPTGVYVSRLEYGGRAVMRKMLFVK